MIYRNLAQGSLQPLLSSFEYEVFEHHEDLNQSVDCFISLGGDGTMLDAATFIRDKGIPLLGINFGRLGFLATIGKEEMRQAVDALFNRTFHIDQRSLLHVDSNVPLFADAPFALNELVVHKSDVSSMIKVHCYLNGEFLNTYWCDGLIISTPTGSTGYNLSSNGPILFPDSSCFAITPIAPHHLNVRPIVVPDSNVISFDVESRTGTYLCSVDARRASLEVSAQVAVRKESFTIGFMRLNENTFLETLRSKLTWGMDMRN
jgi:NAD+ kinase